MRFRLRTLLIVLVLGPPVLAGAWLEVRRVSDVLQSAHPHKQRNVDGPGPDERDDWLVTGIPATAVNAPTNAEAIAAPLLPADPPSPGDPFAAP